MDLKFLLVEPNESVADLIAKNFQREFGAEVVWYMTAAEALISVKKNDYYDLFVVRNVSEETSLKSTEPIAQLFLNAIYDLNLKVPLIVIGEFEHTFKKYALVSERLRIEELNRLALKALELKKEIFSHLKLPDYIAFNIQLFYLMTHSPCSVYIRLVKKAGDEYIKRLNFGENFNKEDLQKYEELGLKDFYILREERELFINGLLSQSLKAVKSISQTNEPVAVTKTGDSFIISSEMIKTLGITPACVAMVDHTVGMIKNQIIKSDKLGLLIKRLMDNQLSYSYRRSYLICLLSYTLLPRMEWGSGDQQNILLDKLAMVSFFHDIYIEEERLLRINDHEGFKKAQLTPREKELVLNHANRAAMLVQSYPKLPQGVDLIIKQHHGVSNGVGFPEVLTASISPMAVFFVVVEDLVSLILNNEDLALIPAHIKQIKERYQLPSYRKVVTEIEMMFIRK